MFPFKVGLLTLIKMDSLIFLAKEDGAIPFMDTIVKPEADGTLSIIVNRKPTHTDQYLQWDSHHHLSAKLSVIHTLTCRTKTVCSNPELLHKEKAHLRKAQTQCNYPNWALDQMEKRLNEPSREVSDEAKNQDTVSAQPAANEIKTKGHLVIPYTQGLCEGIKKICGKYGKPTSKVVTPSETYWSLPRDKHPMINKSGSIYWFQCGDLSCDDEYTGETSRIFGERYKEHLKDLSPIHQHSNHTGHPTSHNNFQIIGREGHSLAKNIEESILLWLIIPH